MLPVHRGETPRTTSTVDTPSEGRALAAIDVAVAARPNAFGDMSARAAPFVAELGQVSAPPLCAATISAEV